MNMNERIKLATKTIEKNTQALKKKQREKYKISTTLVNMSSKSLTILSLLLGLVIALNILMILTANCETINESILITINNSTDWRTNLSTCCNWMG